MKGDEHAWILIHTDDVDAAGTSDEILDEKSGSEAHIKAQSVVFDRNGNLALYSQPALFEFVGEDGFGNGLE